MSTSAQAAICHGPGTDLTLEAVELDDLRPDELRVRMVACGVCHTDLAVMEGHIPVPAPVVLGHEGAGIVEEVGSAVTVAKPGDRVVMSFHSCGDCPSCAVDSPTYCYNFLPYNWSGKRADGSRPMAPADGGKLSANFFGQSSFATHAITHERNTVKVPDSAAHIPLEQLAPIGCGLMTGAGAVLRSMQVRAGMPIAVFGTGTVGMAAVMAAKIAGANPIIAVDVNNARLDLARELGATHAFNGAEDAIGKIRALVPQGLAYAFDTTGLKQVIEDAFTLIAPKGILGLVGASPPDVALSFNESSLMGGGKRVIGILGGDSDGAPFLRQLVDYHLSGQFPFERLIGYFDFADINAAIHASHHGEVVKPVLRISPE